MCDVWCLISYLRLIICKKVIWFITIESWKVTNKRVLSSDVIPLKFERILSNSLSIFNSNGVSHNLWKFLSKSNERKPKEYSYDIMFTGLNSWLKSSITIDHFRCIGNGNCLNTNSTHVKCHLIFILITSINEHSVAWAVLIILRNLNINLRFSSISDNCTMTLFSFFVIGVSSDSMTNF